MNQKAELVFFSKWISSPFTVASVTPSSSQLASAVAAVLPASEGLVIELGGGTGPITHALLNAGVEPDHLVVIERDPDFHRYLKRRFPEINVLCGDALHMASLINDKFAEMPVRAIVSGLPLLSMNATTQRQLMQQSVSLTQGKGPFIQFSYAITSPLKKSVERELGLVSRCVASVWRNFPPAKVWTIANKQHPMDS